MYMITIYKARISSVETILSARMHALTQASAHTNIMTIQSLLSNKYPSQTHNSNPPPPLHTHINAHPHSKSTPHISVHPTATAHPPLQKVHLPHLTTHSNAQAHPHGNCPPCTQQQLPHLPQQYPPTHQHQLPTLHTPTPPPPPKKKPKKKPNKKQ